MAFHVYPDEVGNIQDHPLTIAAGADSGFKSLGAQPGAGTLYVRVAWQSAMGPAPEISLIAGTGDPVIVPNDGFTHAVYSLPAGGGTDAGDAILDGPADGVYRLQVFLNAAATWQIRFKNKDAVTRAVTWVAADSDGASKQPWINVAPTGSYNVFSGQKDTFALHLENHGTGPMTVTAEVVADPGFAVTPLPAPIPPLGAGDLIMTYTGAATPGEVTAVYTATQATTGDSTSKPGASQHNNRVTLTALTRLVEAVFLVDASGSMAYTPDGGHAALPDQARWGKLKTGASQAFNLLTGFAKGKGKCGLAEFPDITTGVVPAPAPSSKVLVSSSDISDANVTNMVNELNAHSPVENGGATPMGHGIGTAIGGTAGSFGMFQSTASAKAYNERFLVVQSDGANNSNPPPPTDFYGAGADAAGLSFTAKKVKVISAGYGKPGTLFEVNEPQMKDLATSSGGYYLSAYADDSGMALRKAFRQAVVDGLHLDPTADPQGFLSAAHPERRYEVGVLPFDTKVAFVVDWTTANAPISVTLVTPLCEVITEQSAPGTPGILYQSHPFYRVFIVDDDYLRNAANPARPRYGTWTLIVARRVVAGAAAPASEEFRYEVITESRLRMKVTFDDAQYGTGETIGVSATLTVDSRPITHASVRLHLTAPGQSADSWLARSKVTPDLLARAREMLSREDVTAVGIKAFALHLKEAKFDDFTKTRTIPMIDADDSGVYRAAIDTTSVPGNYECYVTAVGLTSDLFAFRREQRPTTRVDVRPSPKFTRMDVTYRRDPGGRLVQAHVRIAPQDQFGNAVMFDPAFSRRLEVRAHGAEAGPLAFNGDGSYTSVLQYPPTATPVVDVAFDGVPVVKGAPLISLTGLSYVDIVRDVKLGHEAKPGVNAHHGPKDALGDPFIRPKEQFLSLGGFGWIVFEIKGRTILAQGRDDITVFVEPDESPRPYLVEAARDPNGREWVALGTSPGVTQPFSLGNLKGTRLVRVSDRSGRIRDNDQTALATPGVSIVAVGARKVEPY